MKYFLVVDKGLYEKFDKRFIVLNLSPLGEDINNSLNKNNNLKEVCKFTMSFSNALQLKEVLIAKKILSLENRYWDLKIAYRLRYKGKERIKLLDIPYKKEEKYFKFENLAMIIKDNAFISQNFWEAFMDYFAKDKYILEEFYQLREIENLLGEDVLYDRIRAFINAKCVNNGKTNFRKFYEIAMLVAKLDNRKWYRENTVSDGKECFLNLSEEKRFKWEEWQEKIKQSEDEERQLKLF